MAEFELDYKGLILDLDYDADSRNVNVTLNAKDGTRFDNRFIERFCEAAAFNIKDNNEQSQLVPTEGLDENLDALALGNIKLPKVKKPAVPQAEILELSLNGHVMQTFRIGPDNKIVHDNFGTQRKLTAFEEKLLSRDPDHDFSQGERMVYEPKIKTDLHTHFNGCLSGEDLIRIGVGKKENPVLYPTALLDREDIKYPKDRVVKRTDLNFAFKSVGKCEEFIELKHLSEDARIELAHAMSVPIHKRVTFNQLEEIYDLRRVISDNKELFKDIIWQVARDYKAQGVEYAELSMTQILDPEILKIAEVETAKISKELGVDLAFLATISRHSAEEKILDQIDAYKALSSHPLLVGIDIAGQEDGPTPTWILKKLGDWAKDHCPDMVMRVHAGESPVFTDNVYDALAVAHEYGIHIRIGHGVYGLDGKTRGMVTKLDAKSEELKKKGRNIAKRGLLMVEMNPDSNLALNNIDLLDQHTMTWYIPKVATSFGTDGYGTFNSGMPQVVQAAKILGCSEKNFKEIEEAEQGYLDWAKSVRNYKLDNYPDNFFEQLPHLKKRYTPEVEDGYRQERQGKISQLETKLQGNGVETDIKKTRQQTKHKKPIWVCGSGEENLKAMTPKQEEEIRIAFRMLATHLNPDSAYMMCGGRNRGIDRWLFEEFQQSGKRADGKQIIIRGSLSETADPQYVAPNTITHAAIGGDNPINVQAMNVRQVKDKKGYMVAIGGGKVVSDAILLGADADLNMHLMKGPQGASSDKVQEYRHREHAFDGAKVLIKRLYEDYKAHHRHSSRRSGLFREGFDIEKLNDYYREARTQVRLRKANHSKAEVQSAHAVSVLLYTDDAMQPLRQRFGDVKDPTEPYVVVFQQERTADPNDPENKYCVVSGLLNTVKNEDYEEAAIRKMESELGLKPLANGGSVNALLKSGKLVPLDSYMDYANPSVKAGVKSYAYKLSNEELQHIKLHIGKITPNTNTYDVAYAEEFGKHSHSFVETPMLMPLSQTAGLPFLYPKEAGNFSLLQQRLEEQQRGR